MNKILVENRFGHGGIRHSRFRHWLKRKMRPKLGKAEQPYDWNNPISDPNYPVKNQGINYSCGRQAGSYAQRTLLAKIGKEQGEISARSGYAQYCAEGGGMTVDSVETCIGAYGGNLEATMPSYDAQGSPLTEQVMETNIATPQTDADALTRAGFTPVSVNIDKDSMAEAIRDYGCIIMLIEGQNGNQPANWTTVMPSPPVKNNPDPLWQHYMMSCFTNNTAIGCYNSWGTSVGLGGKQFFDETYINSGYILDVFTFIPDNVIQSLPVSMPIWASLLNWFNNIIK